MAGKRAPSVHSIAQAFSGRANISLRMPHVILVDDSGAVRGVLASRLRERGYDVEEAADGVAGAELALEHPPDVVVTDLWMPGLSGVQLCRLLRSEPRTQGVPVILVTGESDRRSRFWARSAGAAASACAK